MNTMTMRNRHLVRHHIKINPANKGRVERAHLALQDRLLVEELRAARHQHAARSQCLGALRYR